MAVVASCAECPGAVRELGPCLLAEQRVRLSGAVVAHTFRPHESVFHEGTPALAVYCVATGSLKLFRRLSTGQETVTGVRGAGDLVGLRGVLAGEPYARTAQTLETSTLCAIPAETFLHIARENAGLAMRLLARLARESRDMESVLVERGHQHSLQRTAAFLLRRFRGGDGEGAMVDGDVLTMEREAMAQLVGSTVETLSRALHALVRAGAIEVDHRRIRRVNDATLRRLAGER